MKAVAELRMNGIAVDLALLVGSATFDEVVATCIFVTPGAPEDPETFSMIDEALRQRFEDDDNVSDAYPVTPLQEGLLAASLAGRDDYTYRRVWNLTGVEIPRLQHAMLAVFQNSAVLRTIFIPNGKSYLQVVRTDVQLPWHAVTGRLAPYTQLDVANNIAKGEPLFDITVIEERSLVVTMHHALFDFWSHRFFYQDVAAIYYGKNVVERPPFKRFVKHILDADHSVMDGFWNNYLAEANRTTLNHAPGREHVTVERGLEISFKSKAQTLGITTGKSCQALAR